MSAIYSGFDFEGGAVSRKTIVPGDGHSHCAVGIASSLWVAKRTAYNTVHVTKTVQTRKKTLRKYRSTENTLPWFFLTRFVLTNNYIGGVPWECRYFIQKF